MGKLLINRITCSGGVLVNFSHASTGKTPASDAGSARIASHALKAATSDSVGLGLSLDTEPTKTSVNCAGTRDQHEWAVPQLAVSVDPPQRWLAGRLLGNLDFFLFLKMSYKGSQEPWGGPGPYRALGAYFPYPGLLR